MALAAMAMLALPAAAGAAPKADDAAVALAQARGVQIFDYDRAAWVSTDALLQVIPQGKGVAGWVVTPRGEGLHVTYYGLQDGSPVAIYVAEVVGGKVVSSHRLEPGEDTVLTPAELQLVAARRAVKGDGLERCGAAPFNSVVLPPERPGGPVLVYFLTPQVKAGEFPFGGHYRFEVGADGKVLSQRPFTRSCVTVEMPANAAAGMITHLLDPTPTEIHVFLSLSAGKPIYVMTTDPQQLWSVEGPRIRRVKGR